MIEYPFEITKPNPLNFNKNWAWFLLWGIILMALGGLAICYSVAATVISVFTLGIIIGASGVVIMFDAFHFWRTRWGAFFGHLIVGVLYFFFGITLIKLPILGEISLTLILSIFYIIIGAYRIIYSLIYNAPNNGWRLFNGVLSILIGILILSEWPQSGLFIIGLFIGIDLVMTGWVYILSSLAAHRLAKT